MYMATNNTRTEAVRLADRRRSSKKGGKGTNITNTSATAIKGIIQSRELDCLAGAGLGGAGFMI
jgi:hypothetical protein